MSELTDQLCRAGESARGTDLGGLLQWAALHIDSQDAALHELREECTDLLQRVAQQDLGYEILAEVLGNAVKFASRSITRDAFADSAKDAASYRNIMAIVYGSDTLGAPLPPKRTRKPKAASA